MTALPAPPPGDYRRRTERELELLVSDAKRSELWDQPERDELIRTIPELVAEILELRRQRYR